MEVPGLIKHKVQWDRPKFDFWKYLLAFFGERIIAVRYKLGWPEEKIFQLTEFVENVEYQKDGVPIGVGGYIVEIRNPDSISRRSIGDNKEPNGEYILDVLFDGYGIRRRTIHQVKPCLQWWEKNPIDYD